MVGPRQTKYLSAGVFVWLDFVEVVFWPMSVQPFDQQIRFLALSQWHYRNAFWHGSH
jgi:hypothetical protein